MLLNRTTGSKPRPFREDVDCVPGEPPGAQCIIARSSPTGVARSPSQFLSLSLVYRELANNMALNTERSAEVLGTPGSTTLEGVMDCTPFVGIRLSLAVNVAQRALIKYASTEALVSPR